MPSLDHSLDGRILYAPRDGNRHLFILSRCGRRIENIQDRDAHSYVCAVRHVP
jgi:hypothetical protein